LIITRSAFSFCEHEPVIIIIRVDNEIIIAFINILFVNPLTTKIAKI